MQLAERALAIACTDNDATEVALCISQCELQLGVMYEAMGRTTEAILIVESALHHFFSTGNDALLIALRLLAECYIEVGQQDKSMQFLQRADANVDAAPVDEHTTSRDAEAEEYRFSNALARGRVFYVSRTLR